MRTHRTRVFGAAVLALSLVLAACGGDDTSGEDTIDGPTITVTSFNFPESTILAEIYAQALEANGYPVETNLNLGSRELIFPEIEAGNVDLLPEYVASALQVGFGADAPASLEDGLTALESEFSAIGMTVLEPTPAEDKNVFVVTQAFADANSLSAVSDLANAGDITLAGPPECEDRQTCFAGLVDVYGLTNLTFESIAEGPARLAALEEANVEVTLLFSTDPAIVDNGLVALDDDQGLIAAENIVPVVSTEVADAYGDDMANLINDISSRITTELLLDLNGRANDAQDPDEIATDWLTSEGFLEG